MLAASSIVGSLPGWLLLLLGVFVAWHVSKGGGGAAVTELAKANEVLERRLHELGAEVRDLKVENAMLAARTNFEGSLAAALGPLAAAMGSHENGAKARSEALLKILDERLPSS